MRWTIIVLLVGFGRLYQDLLGLLITKGKCNFRKKMLFITWKSSCLLHVRVSFSCTTQETRLWRVHVPPSPSSSPSPWVYNSTRSKKSTSSSSIYPLLAFYVLTVFSTRSREPSLVRVNTHNTIYRYILYRNKDRYIWMQDRMWMCTSCLLLSCL